MKHIAKPVIDDSFPLSEPYYADWEALPEEEEAKEDTRMAIYAAMIDRVDQNIGKLLERIEARGELDNTLVLFAADNGCAAGSLDNYSKFNPTANKGGTCTPLIACWPKGIKGKNRISHDVGHFIDFMPTLVEVSGATYPTEFDGRKIPPMQGRSLIPIFSKKIPADRGTIFWQWSKGKGVRHEYWRLVSDNYGPWELYDMRKDKTETNDLVKNIRKLPKNSTPCTKTG